MTLGDFSAQAASYSRSRPTYPAALIDRLIADAGVAAGDAVADFGAGTGIFTRLLVERGFLVTAIEPNESMRQHAETAGARWLAGTFENSGLEDASQRWAVAAQAFHWAEPASALPEIRCVLHPGGVFTVLWNNRARGASDILDWTENAIRKHVPEFDEAYRDRPWNELLESTGDFSFLIHRTACHTIRMSKERFLNLWRSHNRLNILAGPERFHAFLLELDDYLNRGGVEFVEVPYRCEAWSARRRD
jgi:SAM-dependent methyltransferase